MKKHLLVYLLLTSWLYCFADSILSFDLPKDYIDKRDRKKLLLSIKIPAELNSDQEAVTKKKIDTSYVELAPWTPNTKPLDYEKLNLLASKGLITGTSDYLLKAGRIKNRYDICNMLSCIYHILFRRDKEDLIEMGVNKDDIFFVEAMFNQFSEELKSYSEIDQNAIKERLKLLKKQLKGGRGEVRVVEVQEEDDGSTLLYLTLQEDKEKVK
ncbi:MAG: hypothetical protein PHW04_16515 [Candidatus Wallbacteria bacterium]|nr:hypothetical protein [Candidatus Wallbacteria bacterium]